MKFSTTAMALATLLSTTLAAPTTLASRGGPAWSVVNFFSEINSFPPSSYPPPTNNPGHNNGDFTFEFTIEEPDCKTVCYLECAQTTASWYNVQCGNAPGSNAPLPPYYISWGYNEGGDYAVMTVQKGKQAAWFGYNNVCSIDGKTKLGNVGPNAVSTLY